MKCPCSSAIRLTPHKVVCPYCDRTLMESEDIILTTEDLALDSESAISRARRMMLKGLVKDAKKLHGIWYFTRASWLACQRAESEKALNQMKNGAPR